MHKFGYKLPLLCFLATCYLSPPLTFAGKGYMAFAQTQAGNKNNNVPNSDNLSNPIDLPNLGEDFKSQISIEIDEPKKSGNNQLNASPASQDMGSDQSATSVPQIDSEKLNTSTGSGFIPDGNGGFNALDMIPHDEDKAGISVPNQKNPDVPEPAKQLLSPTLSPPINVSPPTNVNVPNNEPLPSSQQAGMQNNAQQDKPQNNVPQNNVPKEGKPNLDGLTEEQIISIMAEEKKKNDISGKGAELPNNLRVTGQPLEHKPLEKIGKSQLPSEQPSLPNSVEQNNKNIEASEGITQNNVVQSNATQNNRFALPEGVSKEQYYTNLEVKLLAFILQKGDKNEVEEVVKYKTNIQTASGIEIPSDPETQILADNAGVQILPEQDNINNNQADSNQVNNNNIPLTTEVKTPPKAQEMPLEQKGNANPPISSGDVKLSQKGDAPTIKKGDVGQNNIPQNLPTSTPYDVLNLLPELKKTQQQASAESIGKEAPNKSAGSNSPIDSSGEIKQSQTKNAAVGGNAIEEKMPNKQESNTEKSSAENLVNIITNNFQSKQIINGATTATTTPQTQLNKEQEEAPLGEEIASAIKKNDAKIAPDVTQEQSKNLAQNPPLVINNETVESKDKSNENIKLPNQKKPLQLSEADKAYFEMLDSSRKNLPEDKLIDKKDREVLTEVSGALSAQNQVNSEVNEQPKTEITHGKPAPGYNVSEDGSKKTAKNLNLSVKEASSDDKASIEKKMMLAYRALISGQRAAAISIYKDIIKAKPDNIEAMFGLASAYQKNLQNEQARSIYVEILQKKPDHKDALNNFLVLVADDSPDDALIELQKLERINPKFSPIPAQIAMIYIKKNDLNSAERNLRRAISLSPNAVKYKYNLAVILDKMGKYKPAIEFYKDVVNAAENDSTLFNYADKIKDRLAYLQSTNP